MHKIVALVWFFSAKRKVMDAARANRCQPVRESFALPISALTLLLETGGPGQCIVDPALETKSCRTISGKPKREAKVNYASLLTD